MSNQLKVLDFRFVAVWTLMLSPSVTISQTVTPGDFDASFIMLPNTRYVNTPDSLKSHSTGQHRITIGHAFLLSQKNDTVNNRYSNWSMNINGSYSTFSHKANTLKIVPSELLYSELGIVHFRTRKNNWAAIQMLSIGINTDFRKISDRDLMVNGGFLFMKRYSSNFSLGFGAFAYNALSMPILLPGFVVRWQSSGKFTHLIHLPTEISTAYETSKNIQIKLAFSPKNINYDTQNKIVSSQRALSYWELPVGLAIKKKYAQMNLMAGGGLMALRSFQFNERGLKNIFKSTPGHMLKANYFINAGMQFQL